MQLKALGLAAALFVSTPALATATSGQTLTAYVAASGGTFDNNPFEYDLLLNAVQAAGLAGALNDPAISVTLCAPNDRAFVRLARDLGYQGHAEGAAFNFIVGALTTLGNGDPIPLLTQILLYHVATEALNPFEVIFSFQIDTLQGGVIRPLFLRLRDNDPGFTDPRIFFPLNVNLSNGILHTIDRVLLPINVP
ncbi:MAG: fasciclin domain-containing protein [Planctomycetota bacterium]|nr:fasciclin domain-containing protein [Planctomycetota bacterium]